MDRRRRLRIAFFWSLTLAVAAGINGWVAEHPMHGNATFRIDECYAQVEGTLERAAAEDRGATLVLGNSYVASSLVGNDRPPAGLGQITVGGLSLPTAVGVVEHLPDRTPVRLVVVGLSYTDASPQQAGRRLHRRHWESNPLARAWYTLPVVRAGGAGAGMMRHSLMTLLHGSAEEGEPLAFESELDTPEHLRRVNRSIVTRLAEYRPFTGRVEPSLIRQLTRLRDACERRGILLFTYTAPVHPELLAGLDPAFLADFRHTVRGTGIAHEDLNLSLAGWEAPMFKDATHASSRGRALVRAHLGEAIRSEFPTEAPPFW